SICSSMTETRQPFTSQVAPMSKDDQGSVGTDRQPVKASVGADYLAAALIFAPQSARRSSTVRKTQKR
ncbi:MAG: hypothetical protein ABIV36_07715, partial [Sphingobium limneticum]